MKYKPKTIHVSKETRIKARLIYETWNQAVTNYTDRRPTLMTPELQSDTKPVVKSSLAASICNWIEENPNWVQEWCQILERMARGDRFMRCGYRSLAGPTLAWLFATTRNNDRGLRRILDGVYDSWREYTRTSDDNMI